MTPSISTSTPILSVEVKKKRFVLPLTVGGVLWIAHYALQLAMGLKDGHVQWGTPLASLDGVCFSGAIIGLCTGLLALTSAVLAGRGALLLTGQGFAIIAALSAVVSLLVGLFLHQRPGISGGVGVVGSCLSATFVALAVKKERAIPSLLANFLLLIGLLTFPIIISFGWLADNWIPAFATDELPFALTGIAYITFARLLSKSNV